MATERVTLNNRFFKLMHRSVGRRFSVQINLIDGVPPDSVPGVNVLMHKLIGGVGPTLAQPGNFLVMPAYQCIPVGSIRAEISGRDSAVVDYTVTVG